MALTAAESMVARSIQARPFSRRMTAMMKCGKRRNPVNTSLTYWPFSITSWNHGSSR